MCDCFHLAFPNWHAPAAGAGRRLRGPEQEAEDDSVCEEPEILERERPRPQGSSPVEEFPVEKQAEEDITDSAHKSGSNKKNRKAGLGSLFDKRASDKMNEAEDMQSGESEIIVKTVREACVEGLVVTGGGKEGIFIKEVKLDSPASKHLSVKEGDQILSATVYFDNVSYEDALQILEHAQPYKMEFCLKRKAEPAISEDAEIIHPKEKDQGSPVMRSERKMKKQQERISWPKFPSFGKGPRVQFKRSHSTSEAEEHRKLEMSPPTSDNDSPLKSPLKYPDGKDKKKKHKVQLKIKMKGHRSKSVEEPQRNEVLIWENQQVEDIIEEKFSEGHEEKMQEIPQVLDGAEYEASSKTGDDDPFQSLSGMGLHEVHLISLGNTLKTTDISVALAEAGKIESSEMEVGIHQKDKPDIRTENQAETVKTLYTISDPSACDNVVLSQAEIEISQFDRDRQGIGKDSLEKELDYGNAELSIQDLDTCVDVTKKSPKISTEKQWKERSVFENESYGIRTRGPLADIATSKTHFVSPVNGLQFMSPDLSEITQVGKMSDGISDATKPTVSLQPKPGSTVYAVDKEDSPLEIKTSKLPTESTDSIQADLEKRSKFKLPKVDGSGFVTHELIKMTEMEKIRTHLPNREDIEIPGMENKETKPSLQSPDIKVPNIEKIINITKEREIKNAQTDEEFNVEDVKVAVSKFPAFKLPEGDITGVLVQREITIMEQKSDKSTLTPRGSPHKISIVSTDSSMSTKSKVGEETSDTVDKDTAIKMPKVMLPYTDEQTSTAVIKLDYTKPQITDYERFGDINYKLPKREDIEIPGMEAIKESKLQNIKGVSDTDTDQAEVEKTKKYSDKKGHEKKSKKPKVTTKGSEIVKLDNQSPDISIKLLKKDTGETNPNERHKFKTPKLGEGENIDVQVQATKILEDNMDKINVPQKTETKFGQTKFKVPTITLPEFTTKVPRGAVDISVIDVQAKEPEIISPEDKLKLSPEPLLSDLDGIDVTKAGQFVPVYGRAQESDTEGQGRKFKLPKFEISFPDVKPPKIICTSKKDDDSSISEETAEVPVMHSPKAQPPYVKPEVSTDLPEVDSEITELKIKRPGFSFPRFGLSKSEHLVPAADVSLTKVDTSLPEGHTEMEGPDRSVAVLVKDGKQKDATKFGSPTKFKIPSIKFPNFGPKITKSAVESSNVDGDINDAEIILTDTKLKASAEPIVVDIKEPDVNNEKSLSIVSEAQGSKFKLPKFGISLPEVKQPKIDKSSNQIEIDISVPNVKGPKLDKKDIFLPKATVGVPPSNVEVQDVTLERKASLPDVGVDSEDIKMKMETPGFSIPESGFSKAEVWAAEGDVSPPNITVALPKQSIEIERSDTNVTLPVDNVGQKDSTKFKLPSFTFPKFGSKARKASAEVSDVDVEDKGPERHFLDAKIKLSAEPLMVDIKVPDAEKETNSFSLDIKNQGIQITEQGSKFKIPKSGISLPEVKSPKLGVSSDEAEIVMSEPLEINIHPPDVEVEGVTAEIKADLPEVESRDTEIKIKTPGFSSPKTGFSQSEIKASEGEMSLQNADVSLPEGSVEIERPAKDVTIPVKNAEQKGQSTFGSPTKFELPSFSLPKFGIKGPKASVEICDVNVDLKGPEISLPDAEIELSDTDKEIKPPSLELIDRDIQSREHGSKFSLPKFGIGLPEIKGPKFDVSSDKAKLEIQPPEVETQGITAEIKGNLPGMDSEDTDMKIKTPGFSFPRIGFSKSDVKVPESDVSLPNVYMSLPEGNVEIENAPTDVTIPMEDEEQKGRSKFGSPTKFKLPSISLPKFGLKGSKASIEVSDVDVDLKGTSLPDAEIKLSVDPHKLDIKGPDGDKAMKALSLEMKDQDIQFKEQASTFKLPEIMGPKFYASSDKAEIDISITKASVEVHPPNADVQGVPAEIKTNLPDMDSKDTEMKMKTLGFSFPRIGFGKSEVKAPECDLSSSNVAASLPEGSVEKTATDVSVKFDSPTKFELPSISLPKFGIKGPKASVEVSDVDVDVKGPEISLPDTEIKPDVAVEGVTAEIKADLPDMDSKDTDMKIKTSGFSFPGIGFSTSGVKVPEDSVSLSNVDMSLPEGSVEIQKPAKDVTITMEHAEEKGLSKFGSPKKFELPSINFPKFGLKGPKASVEVSGVDVDVKGPELKLLDAEIKLSDTDKEIKPANLEIKNQDIQIKEHESKFKLPKFGMSLPDIKGPKINVSSDKAKIDTSAQKAKLEVQPPDVAVEGVTAEIKADLPDMDSKDSEIKIKTPGFSFPKIGFSKSEVKSSEGDVSLPNTGLSLPEESVKIEKLATDVTIPIEDEQKGRTKFGSPTKFKLPSFNLPKFGLKGPKASVEVSDVDVDVKGSKLNLPHAEIKLAGEPLTVDIKGPDVDKEMKPSSLEMKNEEIQIKEKGSKFKLPKFDIGLPEISGPKYDASSDKADVDISIPKAKGEIHPSDVEVQGVTAEMKADLPDMDSKDTEMKMKTPGFSLPRIGFSKSEGKAPEGEVSLPNVDVSLSEGNVEVERPAADATIPMKDAEQKGKSKFGSPTKFKLPSINLPKFGLKGPKASVEVSAVDIDAEGPQLNVLDAEIKLSAEAPTVDIKRPDGDKELKPPSLEMNNEDIQFKEKGSKLKLPKFDIGLPEIKGPKFGLSTDKAEIDISAPTGKVEVHSPDVGVQGVPAEIKSNLPEVDSKDTEMKMKTPSFLLPRIGFSKSEGTAPEVDETEKPATDITVPMEDETQKGRSKFGSPTKFKLPSINLPKFGLKGSKASAEVSAVDVDAEGPEINVPDTKIKLSAEPLTVDIKRPDADKEMKPPSFEMKDQDIQIKEKGSKFKLPKFDIGLPEIKGPKFDASSDKADVDISLPKAMGEIHPSDVEVQGVTAEMKADLPDMDSKDTEMKMKTPGFSLSRIGFSKSEGKAPEGEVSLPNIDVSLSKANLEVEIPAADATLPMKDAEQKGRSKFGSPTKFKLPSINLPKFRLKGPKASVEVSAVDVDAKGPEINVPDAEIKLSAESPTVDIKRPDGDKEINTPSFEMKNQDIQNKEQGSKFKLPKFGIGLPEIKAPKPEVSTETAEIDISVPKAMVDVHPPEVEVQAAKIEANLPNMDSKETEIKIKIPGFSLPRIGFSKSEEKAPEGNVSLPNFDMTLPEANVEIGRPDSDKMVPVEDADQKGQPSFGSATKSDLPSITLPKFEIEGPKASIEVSDVDVDIKESEISLPDAEMKFSAEPLTVDIKGPDANKEIKPPSFGMKDKNIQIKEQGSAVKLPKFGISLDMSLPEGNVEIEEPSTDITVPVEDAEQKGRAKFGSPTKFKLPSINLPKFGFKGPKASVEVSDVDVEFEGPEINRTDAEIKLSAEPLDIKGPDADKELKPPNLEMKDQGIQIKEKVSKFKLPKFEIGLPEIKGPKFDSGSDKAELYISVPTTKLEVQSPDVEVQGVITEIKADLPDMDSKETEIKIKTPGFSFSRIGFGKAKAPEGEVSLPNIDESLSKGSLEIEKPSTEVSIPVKDAEPKGRSKFGSPTKFKLPSINLPKFGIKGPKASVEVTAADVDVKKPEISLPDAEMKLSAEPLTVDINRPDADKELKPPSLEIKDQEIQSKEKGSKFKFPKFEIGLPEIKGPKFDVSSDKAELEISEPTGKVEVHPPDVEMQSVTAEIKAKLPDIDPKDLEIKMKTPGFSFHKIGFSKSEEEEENNASLPHIDMTLPEGSVELEKLASDVTMPMDDAEQKGRLKFGSPTKFKLPSINLPKFGIKGPKASGDVSDVAVDVTGPEINPPDAAMKLSTTPLTVDIKGLDTDKKIKPPSLEMKDEEIQIKEKGSKFKFGFSLPEVKGQKFDIISDKAEIDSSVPKVMVDVHPPDVKVQELQDVQHVTAEVKSDLPEVAIPGFGSQVGKCKNVDTVVNDNTLDVILEPNQKHTPGAETSSKFIIPTLGDVFRGFEVEFNVPKLNEIEEAMKKYSDPLKHENNIAVSGQESSSPTKTAKDSEKVTSKLLKYVHSPQGDIIEFKEGFTREIDEETVSPTLSLSSSDAFADVSSALTTELIGPSLASPTKVKVKYSEPTSNADVSAIHGDIITSTARTELISMEPHKPEKVNIPFSSETSSSSVDTLKQMSGHIVVSNVQSMSKTEHAAILTKIDTQHTQTLPPEKVGDSVFSVEETIIRKGHTIVEKHVVKEIFGDDKEKIFVTQRIQVFEGDATEPISDDTASSIQKLRDTVHTEKIRFFEGAESSQVQTVITSTETLLRHADSSTDENEGK